MPNLIADRGFWVARQLIRLNVRRLMYQTLIWVRVLGDDARSLRTPLDTEDLQRLADTLVYGVWGDAQLRGDLLGAQMLVYEAQAVELAARQARDARSDRIIRPLA